MFCDGSRISFVSFTMTDFVRHNWIVVDFSHWWWWQSEYSRAETEQCTINDKFVISVNDYIWCAEQSVRVYCIETLILFFFIELILRSFLLKCRTHSCKNNEKRGFFRCVISRMAFALSMWIFYFSFMCVSLMSNQFFIVHMKNY